MKFSKICFYSYMILKNIFAVKFIVRLHKTRLKYFTFFIQENVNNSIADWGIQLSMVNV